MQKTTLLIACIIISVFSMHAQIATEKPKDKKVTFGIRTGYEFQVNNSNLNYKLNLPYVGAFTDIRLNEKWGLLLELNLRSEKREELFNNGFRANVDELYLTVPVLLKYKAFNKLNFYAGTQVLSASLVNHISGFKKWNSIFGLQYNLTKSVFFDGRFRHGFEKRKSTNNFRDNRVSIGIGYKF
ncbi:porin family protein [uncultured Lacinutrix sp.]|uniref:porin family protein n=1 Tax=uncultured Lacinutrix sp. TaxID=574032 RepID=UPI00260B7970|nr:porin family protein [uncultured Lacinutrix sp.]